MSELSTLFDGLQAQIKAGSDSQEKALRQGLKGVRAHVDANHEILNKTILKQNTRIGKLEDDTKGLGLIRKHKGKILILAVLFVFACIFAYNQVDFRKTVNRYLDEKGIELKDSININ